MVLVNGSGFWFCLLRCWVVRKPEPAGLDCCSFFFPRPAGWILDPGSWLVVSVQIPDQNLVQGPFLVQSLNQIIGDYWFWYLVLNLRLWSPV